MTQFTKGAFTAEQLNTKTCIATVFHEAEPMRIARKQAFKLMIPYLGSHKARLMATVLEDSVVLRMSKAIGGAMNAEGFNACWFFDMCNAQNMNLFEGVPETVLFSLGQVFKNANINSVKWSMNPDTLKVVEMHARESGLRLGRLITKTLGYKDKLYIKDELLADLANTAIGLQVQQLSRVDVTKSILQMLVHNILCGNEKDVVIDTLILLYGFRITLAYSIYDVVEKMVKLVKQNEMVIKDATRLQ
ncbi:hypothetical protein BRC2024_KCUCJSVR_CDS_0074 [Acinetobacter phage vB_AbaM_KissB]